MKNKKPKEELTSKNISSRVPNKMHFQVQLTTRMQIQKNKKKYTRKIKHKNKDF